VKKQQQNNPKHEKKNTQKNQKKLIEKPFPNFGSLENIFIQVFERFL